MRISDNYLCYKTKILGKGTFGIVYEGLNIQRQMPVAIKTHNFHYHDEYKYMLMDEAKILEILQKHHHPNIIKMEAALESDDKFFVVLEYCERGSLDKQIKDAKGLPEKEVFQYLDQLVSGCSYMKKMGIVHRDIKLENVLVTKNKTLKISDFGTARCLEHHQMHFGVMDSYVGTRINMAPSIIKRQSYTSKCDVWSLGVMVYYLLTGKHIYDRVFNNEMNKSKQSQFQELQQYELEMERLGKKMLEGNYDQFFKNFISNTIVVKEFERCSIEQLVMHIQKAKGEKKFEMFSLDKAGKHSTLAINSNYHDNLDQVGKNSKLPINSDYHKNLDQASKHSKLAINSNFNKNFFSFNIQKKEEKSLNPEEKVIPSFVKKPKIKITEQVKHNNSNKVVDSPNEINIGNNNDNKHKKQQKPSIQIIEKTIQFQKDSKNLLDEFTNYFLYLYQRSKVFIEMSKVNQLGVTCDSKYKYFMIEILSKIIYNTTLQQIMRMLEEGLCQLPDGRIFDAKKISPKVKRQFGAVREKYMECTAQALNQYPGGKIKNTYMKINSGYYNTDVTFKYWQDVLNIEKSVQQYIAGNKNYSKAVSEFQKLFRIFIRRVVCPEINALQNVDVDELKAHWVFLKLSNAEIEFPLDKASDRYIISRFYSDFVKITKDELIKQILRLRQLMEEN